SGRGNHASTKEPTISCFTFETYRPTRKDCLAQTQPTTLGFKCARMTLCRDFLLNPETREKTLLWVDKKAVHYRLTTRCLLICRNLKKNTSGLSSDRTQRTEIN
ncbi:hypothetical protein N7449_011834, partial [Penicillium cf. viridicatum]